MFGVLTRGVADAALLYDLLADASAVRTTNRLGRVHCRIRSWPIRAGSASAWRLGWECALGARPRSRTCWPASRTRSAAASLRLGGERRPGELALAVHDPRDANAGRRRASVGGTRTTRAPNADGTAHRIAHQRSDASLGDGRQRAITARTKRVFDAVDLVLTPTLAQPPVEAGEVAGMPEPSERRGA